ncbi:hypothetical protein SUGI_1177590 [Cryptomeria japonica]|nr:hypothetical protein SUGI_1177590 [Cryptomeria japonica]
MSHGIYVRPSREELFSLSSNTVDDCLLYKRLLGTSGALKSFETPGLPILSARNGGAVTKQTGHALLLSIMVCLLLRWVLFSGKLNRDNLSKKIPIIRSHNAENEVITWDSFKDGRCSRGLQLKLAS